jgi:hypothetical protein
MILKFRETRLTRLWKKKEAFTRMGVELYRSNLGLQAEKQVRKLLETIREAITIMFTAGSTTMELGRLVSTPRTSLTVPAALTRLATPKSGALAPKVLTLPSQSAGQLLPNKRRLRCLKTRD